MSVVFGLSKDLHSHVSLSIALACKRPRLARPLEKYANPSVFKTVSRVSASPQFITKVNVITSGNTVVSRIATSSDVTLPILYHQLAIDTHIELVIYELDEVYATATLALFDANYTLKTGAHTVHIDADNAVTVTLPSFDFPVVFSESAGSVRTGEVPIREVPTGQVVPTGEAAVPHVPIGQVPIGQVPIGQVSQGIDIEVSVFDPATTDPIDQKYHRLERNTIDKELKPSPVARDELVEILKKPANIELTETEKNLIWRYRYYFTKNKVQKFLVKLIKLINWDNESEVDHIFNDILPHWSPDKIEIGDSLEMLQFDKLRGFAIRRLKLATDQELLLYLLQLVQALKYGAQLGNFLIERAVKNAELGNYFYWFIKVEHEDIGGIFTTVLNQYIAELSKTNVKEYKNLKNQIWLIKNLTKLVDNLRNSKLKSEQLKEYLSELEKFPFSVNLPVDPKIKVNGISIQECLVFKSSLAPLKLVFKTVDHQKYLLMFKIGDDLRQDQLVIQTINLMDQLLKNENLDLKLTPYRILATSPIAGMIQFVKNETVDHILQVDGDILSHLKKQDGLLNVLMDNYIKSCAGYCVITYLLGVGDRHLDNLLISPDGKFWHADFGYILGRDPKPFPPLMKLPIQIVDGMGGISHENFTLFKNYCFVSYTTLRKNSDLIINLFQLMVNANIPDIKADPAKAVEKVQEKFCLDLLEEEAILHFQDLINDSVNAFLPVVIDRLHSLAQYWRA